MEITKVYCGKNADELTNLDGVKYIELFQSDSDSDIISIECYILEDNETQIQLNKCRQDNILWKLELSNISVCFNGNLKSVEILAPKDNLVTIKYNVEINKTTSKIIYEFYPMQK